VIRALTLLLAATTLTACAAGQPYEPLPVSPYQWQQRQERIERAEAERLRRCEAMDKQSERYARECPRAGGAQQ
jgi:outer membrane biogenesis lipoprotein LolB